jgi:uncharacterized phage protein (TIGR01671 family)
MIMREILFRGQKQNGEWLYGDLVHCGEKIFIFSENAQNSPDYYEVVPETVGQFTGLTDKNGVKIFEGDIIQDKYDESCNHVIKYFEEESCFGVLYIGLNGSLTPMSRLAKDWINEFDEVVIGNIHKNPELLTESNFKPF